MRDLVVAADEAGGLDDAAAVHLEDVAGRAALRAHQVVDLPVFRASSSGGPPDRPFHPALSHRRRNRGKPARSDIICPFRGYPVIDGLRRCPHRLRPGDRSCSPPWRGAFALFLARSREAARAGSTGCSPRRPRAREASQSVDRRFEELRRSMDTRVDGVEKRLAAGQQSVADHLGQVRPPPQGGRRAASGACTRPPRRSRSSRATSRGSRTS